MACKREGGREPARRCEGQDFARRVGDTEFKFRRLMAVLGQSSSLYAVEKTGAHWVLEVVDHSRDLVCDRLISEGQQGVSCIDTVVVTIAVSDDCASSRI